MTNSPFLTKRLLTPRSATRPATVCTTRRASCRIPVRRERADCPVPTGLSRTTIIPAPRPGWGRLAFAKSNGSAAGNLLKPFHVLETGGLPIFSHHGSAEYDSLQSAFTTRFQHDSTFQLAYTFSKTYADTLLKVSNGGGNLVID